MVKMGKDGWVDGMPRDERGYWHPEGGTGPPSPLFAWPPKPLEAFKYLTASSSATMGNQECHWIIGSGPITMALPRPTK